MTLNRPFMLEIRPVWLNGNNQVKEIGTNFPHSDVNNSLTVLWTSGGGNYFFTQGTVGLENFYSIIND